MMGDAGSNVLGLALGWAPGFAAASSHYMLALLVAVHGYGTPLTD